jgi:hypothetical protein
MHPAHLRVHQSLQIRHWQAWQALALIQLHPDAGSKVPCGRTGVLQLCQALHIAHRLCQDRSSSRHECRPASTAQTQISIISMCRHCEDPDLGCQGSPGTKRASSSRPTFSAARVERLPLCVSGAQMCFDSAEAMILSPRSCPGRSQWADCRTASAAAGVGCAAAASTALCCRCCWDAGGKQSSCTVPGGQQPWQENPGTQPRPEQRRVTQPPHPPVAKNGPAEG